MIKFTKMHGIGNDYVYVNCFEEKVADPASLARAVSDRHFGIGADGLILILPSERADARMRIFNADGSEAQMCGNGIRCVAKYLYEHGIARKSTLTIETLAGVKELRLTVEEGMVTKVRVDMGRPRLLRGEIPMIGPANERVVNEPLKMSGRTFRITCVNMGNPHLVIFTQNMATVPLERLGPKLERHPLFPERINVHFVQVLGREEVKMRTWERGSGITLACGTGASAVCVAGVLNDRTERRILAHLPGGDLELEWTMEGNVFMTGPAIEVFSGVWPGSS